MNIDMDAPTETEADTFDAVLADINHINHINRLTADEIEDYSMGACLDADALARFYQLPRTTIDEATAL